MTPEPAQGHKCHAGYAKRKGMSPSATCATRNEGGCHQAPRLPRKVPRRHRRPMQSKRATRALPVPQVPRLPRKTKADVAKCHACHAKCRGVTGDLCSPSAPAEPAQCHKCHACHEKRRWMSPSATPAMQNQGRCRQVPRLPRKVPQRHRLPMQSKRASRASPVP